MVLEKMEINDLIYYRQLTCLPRHIINQRTITKSIITEMTSTKYKQPSILTMAYNSSQIKINTDKVYG
jgi:hypothetical protein